MEWGWQFSSLVLVRIIFESFSRVEEWSTISSVFFLSKQIVGIVGNFFIKRLVMGETFTLRESEHLLGTRVVDGSVIFVWHLFFFLIFYKILFLFYLVVIYIVLIKLLICLMTNMPIKHSNVN